MTDSQQAAIYCGNVRHRRYSPRGHEFSYPVFMLYADVENVEAVTDRSPWYSFNRKNVASFFSSDYLADVQGDSLRERADRCLTDAGFSVNNGKTFLLSNWRYWFYQINPISCFYCFDEEDRLQYLVAEVTNTPWKERQVYVLRCDPGQKNQQLSFAKQMHVSPFMPMDIQYQMQCQVPAEQLVVHINNLQGSEKIFDATLSLNRKNVTSTDLLMQLLRYPFMTTKVIAAIHWQALKLFWKKVPLFAHPNKQRSV